MIKFCPHCCNRAPQTILHEQEYEGRGWLVHDGEEMEYDGKYIVARCETCKEILLYHSSFDDEPTLIFPKTGLHSSVPSQISKIYEEAIRIKHIAPNAFAVQIRRALEAICIDRGTSKRMLAQQLKELETKGEIPSTLSEASEVLRLIGNVGAHANSDDVHPLQATAIDDFFKAIVEYVYVSPSRLAKFKMKLLKYEESQAET
jgi:hypothetical protein